MPTPYRPTPYGSSPVFDETSLPAALRTEHRTKAGVWGLLRVIEGEAVLHFLSPPEAVRVTPDAPAPIPPEAPHYVELTGPVRLQVEFYTAHPLRDEAV